MKKSLGLWSVSKFKINQAISEENCAIAIQRRGVRATYFFQHQKRAQKLEPHRQMIRRLLFFAPAGSKLEPLLWLRAI